MSNAERGYGHVYGEPIKIPEGDLDGGPKIPESAADLPDNEDVNRPPDLIGGIEDQYEPVKEIPKNKLTEQMITEKRTHFLICNGCGKTEPCLCESEFDHSGDCASCKNPPGKDKLLSKNHFVTCAACQKTEVCTSECGYTASHSGLCASCDEKTPKTL